MGSSIPEGFKPKPQKQALPKNKELWLIQLPPKFDIKTLESLPFDSVFTHGKKSKSYQLKEDDNSGKLVYLGKPKDDRVKLSEKLKIDRTMTISQVANVPEIDYQKVTVPKPVVPQKEGLDVKHWATGYGPSLAKESKRKHEDEDSPKKLKKLKKEKTEKTEKKDKKEKKNKS